MKTIRNKLIFKAFQAKEAAREKGLMLKARVLDTTGEGYVDTAVKIIIAVVIGGLLNTSAFIVDRGAVMRPYFR